MTQEIHGHEVMQMMIDENKSYTRETLRAAIVNRFGTGTTFFTCSARNMTPDQLMDFLEAKGKFIDSGEGFKTEPDKICNH